MAAKKKKKKKTVPASRRKSGAGTDHMFGRWTEHGKSPFGLLESKLRPMFAGRSQTGAGRIVA